GGHRTGRHAERGRRQPLRPKPARQPRLISRGSSAAGAYFALRGAFFAVLRALAAVFGFFGLAVALAALRPRPPLLGPLASRSASSFTASSSVSAVGSAPRGTLALTAPCFT